MDLWVSALAICRRSVDGDQLANENLILIPKYQFYSFGLTNVPFWK